MRQTYAFLLTVLPVEGSCDELHGRIRTIATGCEVKFTSLEQLASIIRGTVTQPQIKLCDADPEDWQLTQ
jgi:hypothetical protein